jgi:hypothetical protein
MKKANKKRPSKARASGKPHAHNELSEEQLDGVAGGVTTALPTSAFTAVNSGGGDAPTENISFVYGGIEIQYTQQKPDGSTKSSGRPK